MRTNVVVPAAKQVEVAIKLAEIGNLPLIELLFERAEEPFDSAVLPRAAGIGTLVANAQALQPEAEFAAGRDGFVVGSDNFGFAVGVDEVVQAGEQGSGSLVAQGLQVQHYAAAMIENAEQRMQTTLFIGLAGDIQSPDQIAWNVDRLGEFDPAAQYLDFVVVPLQRLMDKGLANRDMPGGGEAAVAEIGNGAASGVRH